MPDITASMVPMLLRLHTEEFLVTFAFSDGVDRVWTFSDMCIRFLVARNDDSTRCRLSAAEKKNAFESLANCGSLSSLSYVLLHADTDASPRLQN